MKYIIMKIKSSTGVDKLIPIIFPDFMSHVSVAGHVQDILNREHKAKNIRVYSAGDCEIFVESVSGESSSLKVSHQEIDSDVINQYDWLHGIGYS